MSVAMHAFRKAQFGDRTYSSLQSLLDDPAQIFMPSNTVERPVGGDLEILSASRYPQGLMQPYEDMEQNPRKRKATTSSNHLYGGIVLTGAPSESNLSSSGEQDQPSIQKKPKSTKRSSANDGDDQGTEKKQRGRPRLDTHDETAADRRRTQIRLAQRAYRHRKETTISALKQKVTDLQTTIEHMNKTFLTLHDNMVDAGILTSHYSLGRQLQSATEEFVALSKRASPESDDEEEAIAKITRGSDGKPSSEPGERNRRSSAQLDAKTSSRPAATKTDNVRRAISFDQTSTDAEADVEELPLIGKEDNSLLALSETAWSTDNSNLHGLNDFLSFNTAIPDVVLFDDPNEKLVIERPLKPAHQPEGSYTYSFQETTFARRLHRMCLERAFRNLTNPHVDPEYIKRAFRFTFCFSNRKRMLQRFQEMLKRKAGESLENWNVPFFHIGGAGTHFPRRDEEGNPIYPPNMINPARAFGPQPYVQAETPRMETSVQEMLENIGFGGVWFDSHDVEEYLKTKGIYLDGQSSFIEVDSSVLPLVKASISTSDGTSSSDRSPLEATLRTPSPLLGAEGLTDPIIDPFVAHELGEMFARPGTLFPSAASNAATTNNNGNSNSGSSAFQNPTKSADDPWADFAALNPTSSPPTFSDLLGRRQNPLTFDVEMFLERMIHGSACLGRAPGFRKDTIDQALVMSLQEGF
ncbi:uncharacterized protein Z519_11340 [Cladophialophora bantiana CBS 173.52]|uniref:BZIP domain-containing protein n=1 Tax=Cladophialophora bantiana (strain ATCC 10958 / CBS 173.52 / CDC B-1940 / NIH 8579) TaxID=1442370 RepID=A0A0D2HUK8_CLAB1|nr:uncharacterized protein Z519_11340 [Cladophialophora bantiana CBS 173.52]KIW88229.1 hypothetical protein Z519_11340 [Cladophialophora bantiana CBS 173.52]